MRLGSIALCGKCSVDLMVEEGQVRATVCSKVSGTSEGEGESFATTSVSESEQEDRNGTGQEWTMVACPLNLVLAKISLPLSAMFPLFKFNEVIHRKHIYLPRASVP